MKPMKHAYRMCNVFDMLLMFSETSLMPRLPNTVTYIYTLTNAIKSTRTYAKSFGFQVIQILGDKFPYKLISRKIDCE
jgi:hypothetical protein